MALATAATGLTGEILPLAVAAAGILASIVGSFFVSVRETADFGGLLWALRRGIFVAGGLVLVLTFLLVQFLGAGLGTDWAIIAGLGGGIVIGLGTEIGRASCREKV